MLCCCFFFFFFLYIYISFAFEKNLCILHGQVVVMDIFLWYLKIRCLWIFMNDFDLSMIKNNIKNKEQNFFKIFMYIFRSNESFHQIRNNLKTS